MLGGVPLVLGGDVGSAFGQGEPAGENGGDVHSTDTPSPVGYGGGANVVNLISRSSGPPRRGHSTVASANPTVRSSAAIRSGISPALAPGRSSPGRMPAPDPTKSGSDWRPPSARRPPPMPGRALHDARPGVARSWKRPAPAPARHPLGQPTAPESARRTLTNQPPRGALGDLDPHPASMATLSGTPDPKQLQTGYAR